MKNDTKVGIFDFAKQVGVEAKLIQEKLLQLNIIAREGNATEFAISNNYAENKWLKGRGEMVEYAFFGNNCLNYIEEKLKNDNDFVIGKIIYKMEKVRKNSPSESQSGKIMINEYIKETNEIYSNHQTSETFFLKLKKEIKFQGLEEYTNQFKFSDDFTILENHRKLNKELKNPETKPTNSIMKI